MSERRAMTKTIATRYRRASKAGKRRILDELCATTGWHRDHARKALRIALRPQIVKPRSPRPPTYGPNVIAALTLCWAVLGMPAGKRLAPMLGELVAVLRRFGELIIDEDTAALLVSMSAATIDRRLAPERRKHAPKGRSTTKPGSLLKSQIPLRTWADWDDAKPGFVEIDLVAHNGGNTAGLHAFTLTVTDIATGWTENRSVPGKARKWVLGALNNIVSRMPFPILGVLADSVTLLSGFSPAAIVNDVTNVVNTLTGAVSTAYATLLPTADVVTTLLTTLPAYDVSLFVQGLEAGDPVAAIGQQIATDTYLLQLAAGFETFAVIDQASTVLGDLTGLLPF